LAKGQEPGQPLSGTVGPIAAAVGLPHDEVGDRLDHLSLDPGISVLGEGTAWVGRDRITALEHIETVVDGMVASNDAEPNGGLKVR
jgi:hypothetical protein